MTTIHPIQYRHNPMTKAMARAEIAQHEKAAATWRRIAAQRCDPLTAMQLGSAVTTLPQRALACAAKREAAATKLRSMMDALPA